MNLMRPIRITPPRSPHIAVERIGPAWSASGYQTDPPAASFRQRPPIRSRYSVCQRTIFTLIGLHTFDAFTASALPFRSRAARSFNTMTRTGFMNRPIHYRNRVCHRPRSGTCTEGQTIHLSTSNAKALLDGGSVQRRCYRRSEST